jgi:hypothetical protein
MDNQIAATVQIRNIKSVPRRNCTISCGCYRHFGRVCALLADQTINSGTSGTVITQPRNFQQR